MSTHARPLAEWLSEASDEQLTTLFSVRRVRADAGWPVSYTHLTLPTNREV